MTYPARVARFGRYAQWLEVTSDRFDHTSELPADANAGNRFYGRDIAEFVSSGLSARAVDARVAEEDWGWLVLARPRERTILEIAVYHNLDDEPGKEDSWNLMVRRRERRLLFAKERPVDEETLRTLEAIFRDGGIASRRVEDFE
jgi:hypothetical protein